MVLLKYYVFFIEVFILSFVKNIG